MTKRLVSVIAILIGVTLLTASIPYNYGYVNAEVVVAEAKVPKYDASYKTYKKVKWVKKSGKWYCKNSKGKYIKGFARISGKTYYFNSKGVMQTKWKTISKKKYYFGSNGAMRTGLKKINKKYYLFSSKGVMAKGWKTYKGEKYYFAKSGAAYKGWKTIGGYEYYFTSKGKMKHDTVVDGKTLDNKGRVVNPSEATATATAAATTTAPVDSTPTASAAASATATSEATATATATATTTGSTSSKYDPDGHGGYWINASKNTKVTSASEFNSTATNNLKYVCSNGNTISYSTYQNMNWSMKNDPKFGANSASSDMYKGSWWQQGYGNGVSYKDFDDTGYVASWIYGTSAAFNAFDYDNHNSGKSIVGEYVNGGKQTVGYYGWNGNAVTGGDYSKWAAAMDRYRGFDRNESTDDTVFCIIPARHDKETCERYGIEWQPQSTKVSETTSDGVNTFYMDINQAEKIGDYIMIEWCEGNLQYNMKTLPVPDYQNYTGMGSIDYEKYFTTCSTLSTKFPVSREWNYSSKEVNVMDNSN